MDTDEFEDQFGATFSHLRQRRGRCPNADDLVALDRNELPEAERRAMEAHLELCGVCQDLRERLQEPAAMPDDATWKQVQIKLDDRPAPWRRSQPMQRRLHWFPAVAAAAVFLVVAPALWYWMEKREPPSIEPSVTRGSSISLQEPAGRVEVVDEFRWSALPAHSSFRLRIQQGDRLVWETSASQARYRATEELKRQLGRNVPFRWRVQGLDDRGQVLDESAWISFELIQ